MTASEIFQRFGMVYGKGEARGRYLVLVHLLPLGLQHALISFPFLFFLGPLGGILHPSQFRRGGSRGILCHVNPRSGPAELGRATHILFTLQLVNLFLGLAVGITVVHEFALAVRAFAGLEIGLLGEDASF